MNKITTTLLVAALAATGASAQVLMLDFGPTTVGSTGGWTTNSPYHTAAGPTFTQGAWNKVETDLNSGLLYADASAATGVTVDVGAITTLDTTLNLANTPSTSAGAGITNSGVYGGTSVGRDFIFGSSGFGGNGRVGIQIGGLAAGSYDIYVTARNTNTAATAATNSQTVYVGKTSASGNFDFSGYSTSTLTYPNPTVASSFTTAWIAGENYVKLSVTLGAGEYLNLAVAGSGSENRGFLNSVQVVSAIPEPSAFAALAGLGALGLVATRRRSPRT